MVIRPGRAPIRSSGGYIRAALRILRSLGTSAHVWAPGASGVSVASLASNNFLLSDGSTGYSTVDGVVGLDLDAMSTTVPIAAYDFSSATGWTVPSGASIGGGVASCTAANGYFYRTDLPTPLDKTFKITFTISGYSAGTVRAYVNATAVLSDTFSSNGTKTVYLKAASSSPEWGLNFATFTGTIDDLVLEQVTGTHLTQATTANKPIVRRGAYNIATYSDAIAGGTGAWTLNAGATQTANNALSPSGTLTATRIVASGAGGNEGIYLSALSTVGRVEVFSLWLKGAVGGEQVMIGDASNRKTVTLTTSWARYSDNGATRVSNHSVIYAVSNTAMTFYASQAQLEAGTTAGDYTPTTATAASNPSAGKYWWSFDGSNDYLTAGSVPFQINEDHAVIVGYRYQGSSAADYVFGVKADAWRTACGLTVIAGKPGAFWYDGTLASEILNATTSYVPVIVTAVKRTNAKQLRVNGAQSGATDNTALSSFTATHAYVGGSSGATASTIDAVYSFDGSISIVIVVKGTLTDAELLLLERFAASVTPGAPVF